jgi:diacylglycerol kinase family enzyme
MKSKPTGGQPAQGTMRRLLIVSRGAGSVTDEVQAKLARAFAGVPTIDFDPRTDFRRGLSTQATVLVAGGDGTIGYVARALAGSRRRMGVLSLGTFNNFARGLGLPRSLDGQIKVIKQGRARPVTLGRVNDQYFLEVAAIGLFGQAIELGERAKDRDPRVMLDLRQVAGAKPFGYRLTGDLDGDGRALSLVFSNTPSTGAGMPVARTDPTQGRLDLSVHVGASRSDIVGRVLASAILDKRVEDEGMRFRFRRVEVHTRPRTPVYADNLRAGMTPVTISADPRALRVILPR